MIAFIDFITEYPYSLKVYSGATVEIKNKNYLPGTPGGVADFAH